MGVGKVEIQIGALVLEGLSRADGQRIGEAYQRGAGFLGKSRPSVQATRHTLPNS